MLSEDLVREIVALRRRVERLEAQEPVAGALRGANAEIDAQGGATLAGGLNVATTGAAGGQVKTAGHILGGANLYLRGQATAYMTQHVLTLADDDSASPDPAGGTGRGLFSIYCSSDGHYALLCRSWNTVEIIADPVDTWRNADTDGYHCVFVDGSNNTVLRNRRGGARSYRIQYWV